MTETETTRPANPPHCKCGAWWTGLTRCHCAGCHVTFSGQQAFNLHRRGSADRRECLLPRDAGLEPQYKTYGVMWSKVDEVEGVDE